MTTCGVQRATCWVMRTVAVATLVTLLASSVLARAETVMDPSEPPGLKSEGSGLALSMGVTAGSWGLVYLGKDNAALGVVGVAGAYFGPSLAQLYAADSPHARGFMLRTAGLVGVLAGAHAALACWWECDSNWLSTSFYAVGGLAIAAGTIDDIMRQPALVRRHNRRVHDVALVPTVSSDSVGFTLGGRF